jgi:hypothetical protein
VSANTSLQLLTCNENKIGSLDVSNNTALTTLECSNNNLNDLDVSNNTALTTLKCSNNNLSSLDVSNNTELTRFFCAYNYLTDIDVSNNASISVYSYEPQNEFYISFTDVSVNTNESFGMYAVISSQNDDGDTVENSNIIWSSSDTKVATVDSDGIVKGISAGTAIITATSKDISDLKRTCTITVTEASTLGDTNGDNNVNISDLMLVLNHVCGKSTLTGTAFTAGDVNGDGKVDLQDLMKILNFVSGKSKEL